MADGMVIAVWQLVNGPLCIVYHPYIAVCLHSTIPVTVMAYEYQWFLCLSTAIDGMTCLSQVGDDNISIMVVIQVILILFDYFYSFIDISTLIREDGAIVITT
jgi:hypothetical protein